MTTTLSYADKPLIMEFMQDAKKIAAAPMAYGERSEVSKLGINTGTVQQSVKTTAPLGEPSFTAYRGQSQ